MKISPAWFVILFSAALLAGCSSYESRLNERASSLSKLTPKQREAMEAGRVEVGYTADMVYVVLGKPERVEAGEAADQETWVYSNEQSGSAWRNGLADTQASGPTMRIKFVRGRVSAILLG